MSTQIGGETATLQSKLSWQSVASMLDQTFLQPQATRDQLVRLCEEAANYSFGCVLLNGSYASLALHLLRGTKVKVGVPVGFPSGATTSSVKRYEAAEALLVGVQELDMIFNMGALKSGDRQRVQADIRAVVEVAHDSGAITKVILSTALLSLEEKILVCELALGAGADFVGAGIGFFDDGATISDIALMRGVVGRRAGVKASSDLRTGAAVHLMIDAGASRIGTTAGLSILHELGAP